jgi:6-phosphogluconate dehydrogenase
MARIWRGGCIIRARFLDRIREAYDGGSGTPSLLLADPFTDEIAERQDAWRRVVQTAVEIGVPVPALSSSLAYYDGYRRERGPASLIQGLRDLFGAHTYKRVDGGDETFHTDWAA